MTPLHERIRRWRENRQLTKAELARLCGVSPEAVLQWERGMTTPTTQNIEKIANALGVSVSVFWGAVPERAA